MKQLAPACIGSNGASSHDPRKKTWNFECAQQVCFDIGHAVLEYGHNQRPQILIVNKKHGKQPRTTENFKKSCSRCVMTLGMLSWSSAKLQDHRMYMIDCCSGGLNMIK